MVHYIGSYIDERDNDTYTGNIPGRLKMGYIINCINKCEETIKILSVCKAKKTSWGVIRKKIRRINDGASIRYLALFSGESKIAKALNLMIYVLQLYSYVLFQVKKSDTVIVYHSLRLTHILSDLRRLKKANWVLEVEEIYGYGAMSDAPDVDKEIKNIRKFDKFITVNDTIPQMLGLKNAIVCYGVYNVPERKIYPAQDGKVHVVYAGTIEKAKMGALTAVKVAEFLPPEYVVHIAGFGAKDAIRILCDEIEAINKKTGCAKIEYHGYLTGEALSNLLYRCRIGLSTYVMRKTFSNSVFPSKLTSYVCHGLTVVVARQRAYELAKIGINWSFYDEYIAPAIAAAVINADMNKEFDYKKLINGLDAEFIKGIGCLLHNER